MEIHEKARQILSRYDIKTLSDDKKIIEILDDIMIKESPSEEDEKMLSVINHYLYVKSKMIQNNAAYLFLKILSERINIQKVRKNDRIAYQVFLFKVKDKDGNAHFSLTRDNLKDKIKNNKELFGNSATIEIESQENTELYDLLENIKNMF